MSFLIESALLIHGLPGVSNDAVAEAFGDDQVQIVWLEAGQVQIGGLGRFLEFRAKVRGEAGMSGADRDAEPIRTARVNHFNLDDMIAEKADGVMTASGAMSIAAREGIDTAVTAGIGGFFPGMLYESGGRLVCDKRIPPDIATLEELPVTLVSSGPKDMLDIGGTFRYLAENGVEVRGLTRSAYSGYLFNGPLAKLPEAQNSTEIPRSMTGGSRLIINEIPEEKRIEDRSVLDRAVTYALDAQKRGLFYHPAVNSKIEELTGGYSAQIQLEALVSNTRSV